MKDCVSGFKENRETRNLVDCEEKDRCPICGEVEENRFSHGTVTVGDEVHHPAVCKTCGYGETV